MFRNPAHLTRTTTIKWQWKEKGTGSDGKSCKPPIIWVYVHCNLLALLLLYFESYAEKYILILTFKILS